MSVDEVLESVREGRASGDATGIALLVDAWRSAPRAPGARFTVAPDGGTAGSISAGCVEADLSEHIRAVTAGASPRLVRYGIADSDAAAVGLSCGGEIEVLVNRLEPDDPVWEWISSAGSQGREGVLVTDLTNPVPGRQLILTEEGKRIGTVGSTARDQLASVLATQALRSRSRPEIHALGPAERLFVEPILLPPRLFAVGATANAIALAELCRVAGLSVTIVEPRETLAQRALDVGIATIGAEPATAFDQAKLGPGDAVAVLAHEPRIDAAALRAALEGGAGYVGLLGGRRTQQARREALLEAGIDRGSIEKIRGPIGLSIGAESPHEIAISILAELVQHWNLPDDPGV
ncbi:MAG: XdhC family protein [marine benthic group bacterium]|nr:XdhC family protein [Gemmatimonadota bacterium]